MNPAFDTKSREQTGVLDLPESAALAPRPELVRDAMATPPKREQPASADSTFGQLSYRHSDHFGKLAFALSQAQGEFQEIEKTLTASVQSRREGARSYSYTYADLKTVMSAVRPALSKFGLALMQMPTVRRGAVVVTTMLVHGETEQWFAGDLAVALENLDPQAVGSATTYARRYGLTALLGVAAGEHDDDGAAARERRSVAPEPPATFSEDTLLDFEAKADEGWAALSKAWNDADKPTRDYLSASGKWKVLSRKAQDVDKARKATS